MPLEKYEWIERREILTFEEIVRLAHLFVGLGVQEVRLTGGEPLLRHGLEALVAKLSSISGIRDWPRQNKFQLATSGWRKNAYRPW